jgi:hypothetical protein
MLTRLLAINEDKYDDEKCKVWIDLAKKITLEDNAATTDTTVANVTLTNDPAQCFQVIQTWLTQKVVPSIWLVAIDITLAVLTIFYGIPCLLGCPNEICDQLLPSLAIFIIIFYLLNIRTY